MKKLLACTSLALAASVSTSALAQIEPTTQLDTILVTPNRVDLAAKDTMASTTVITREEIERRNPRNLPDLIAGISGVHLTNSGGDGQPVSLFLRGTNSDHTLILVDGLRFNEASNGSTNLQHLPVSQIERIEVVRGPRASLYGADAVGGVIQIFTRDEGTIASAGYGSQNTRNLGIGFGVGNVNLAASEKSTDGYDTRTGGNSDDDGYEEKSLAVNGGKRLSQSTSLEFRGLRSQGEVEFDDGVTDFVNQSLSTGLKHQLSANGNMNLRVGQSVDERDTDDSLGGSYDRTIRRELSAVGSLGSPFSRASVGVDYYDDDLDTDDDFAETSRYNYGIFGQYQRFLGPWDLQLAARYDDNEAFGTETTGSAAVGRSLGSNARVFLSHGTAFKAPSFNDLYSPDLTFGGTTFSSNPDLDPEKSRSTELGFSWSDNQIESSVSVFYTKIDDLINNQTVGSVSKPQNIDQARIRGIETALSVRIHNWDLTASVTAQDPEDLSDGSILAKRSERLANLSASTMVGHWALQVDYRYVGETGGGQFSAVPSYAVAGLSLQRSLGEEWSVRLNVDNVFDKQYETNPGFPAPERTALFTLEWKPGAE